MATPIETVSGQTCLLIGLLAHARGFDTDKHPCFVRQWVECDLPAQGQMRRQSRSLKIHVFPSCIAYSGDKGEGSAYLQAMSHFLEALHRRRSQH